MLVCYAKELKEGFADYVEETVKLLVPLLKFYLHDNVRIAAAESLPFLIEAGQAKVRPATIKVTLDGEMLRAGLFRGPSLDVYFESLTSFIAFSVTGNSDEMLENIRKFVHLNFNDKL